MSTGMARFAFLSACLLATLLVAGAMPIPASAAAAAEAACSKSGDDPGFGGSKVKCSFSCARGSALAIGVQATDSGASTFGDGSCADQSVGCTSELPRCDNVSLGVTSYADPKASCNGGTDEWWSSPVVVACATTPDPVSTVCQLIRDFCDFGPTPRVPPIPAAGLKELCLAQNPTLDPASLLVSRIEVLGAAYFGFVAAEAGPDLFATLVYVPAGNLCIYDPNANE